jgi:hypothetical protein
MQSHGERIFVRSFWKFGHQLCNVVLIRVHVRLVLMLWLLFSFRATVTVVEGLEIESFILLPQV